MCTITIEKIGTWNIRNLQGKEEELHEKFVRMNLITMGITKTKKLRVTIELDGRIQLDVEKREEERAVVGVRCVIYKKIRNEINR